MASRWWLALAPVVLLAQGCENARPPVGASSPRTPSPGAFSAGQGKGEAARVGATHLGAAHPKVTPLAPCRTQGQDPLGAARKAYDSGQHEAALSCAAQATALTPDDPRAHSEKGAALSALGRFDEAQVSYARALAIDPSHLDGLLGAAHLYGVTLPSSRERDELALAYAERGLELSDDAKDARLIVEFALLSAMAFNDLGQARDALIRADEVLRLDPTQREARYERAVALFELCRFDESRQAFTQMVNDTERAAHAHHHLGLLFERAAKHRQADLHFERARALAPEDFPSPQTISPEDFRREVERALAALPVDMRRDLKGIPVTAEELPLDEDLLSGEPPLSPAILGLFRGPPLGERCERSRDGRPCRSVALYRRNLARAVRSREELVEQIRVTLLHEVGHLRGEDDFELAARGLE